MPWVVVWGREVQNRVEANQHARAAQSQAPRTVTERQCHTVMESHEEHQGYDVTYRIDGEVKSRRMETAPQAERLPVVDGQVQWQAGLEASTEG